MSATTRTVVTITITDADASDPPVAIEHDTSPARSPVRDALLRGLVQLPRQLAADAPPRRTV
jgi:hypothetical protein